MVGFKPLHYKAVINTLVVGALFSTLFAYNGSETWLHYTAVPADVKAEYLGVCKSLVLSDPNSDTLKNAQAEFDIAIPKLLGAAKLPVVDAAGAIVLAPQGSPLVPADVNFSNVADEGFVIKSSGGKTIISGKNQVAVLRGAFHFIRLMQTGKSVSNLNIVENPYFPYRVLDHWLNHYGSNPETERVYAGGRPFKMENFGNLNATEKSRVIDYCRMAVSVGLNGMCPDNVNTFRGGGLQSYLCLEEANMKTQKVFADLIGTYGLKYYLSVSFASPKNVTPKISSINPEDAAVAQWWNEKVDLLRSYIKNFGGFLMKADSEGEDGPFTSLNFKQSRGANPMAKALQRYGYVLIWRTFIYSTPSDNKDFVNDQSDFFKDQTWEPGVILRMKDGPRDFQTVEPPHPLLRLSEVRKGMEFQITQEYTGQAIHLNWLVPKWKQILDYDMKVNVSTGTAGSVTHQILRGTGRASDGGGVWAISNFSDTVNWTGNFLHQANSYGWGRLSWNPLLTQEQIADEWIRCSFDAGNNYGIKRVVYDMLRTSWKAYEDYTISYSALMPALYNNDHYEIDFLKMSQSSFFITWFMNFKSDGIGVDRTVATGNKAVSNYSTTLQALFENKTTCPEEYLLFFHHLPWEYKMKTGMTLIQGLQYNHFRGLKQVQKNINAWDLLKATTPLDAEIYSHVKSKLQKQQTDATRWALKFRSDFGTYYKTAVPCDISIVTPTPTKAATAAVGTPIALSATLKNQNGGAETGTFVWSVVEPASGGVLSAASGQSITFTGNADGVYTVRLSNTELPDMTDEMQVFVGNWWEEPTVAVKYTKKKLAMIPFSLYQNLNRVIVTVPSAGKIDIFTLNGSVVKSMTPDKAGVCVWDARNTARGIYMVKFAGGEQVNLQKVVLK